MTALSQPNHIALACLGLVALAVPCHAQTLYNFGNPTAEEQLYIEFINRARADPAAEGARLAAATDPEILNNYTFFGVDLPMMQSEFNAIPATPPLAPHASLTAAARGHSLWMLNNATQSHDETNPDNTAWDRISEAGYTYSSVGENIFAYVENTWHGHAGFQVDWGGPVGAVGGMQDPRGHRDSIHSPDFREIGVGVVVGTNGNVGPQLVTEDFGTRQSSPSLGTGVAYYDLNANNFYDAGEGISGLTVNLNGTSTYCTTATGGGWVVPAPDTSATTRTITFTGLNVNESRSIVFPASKNAKTDLKLAYSPPAITSSATATAGSAHALSFTAVGGATGYTWSRSSMSAAAAENCENTANITSATTGTYAVLSTTVKQQGTGSFRLMNATGASQWLQLAPLYQGGASPSLAFQSRLRLSSTDEQFKVQVKEEGTAVWQDVYSQTGFGGSGETTFNPRTAALTSMAGKTFRVRFLLQFTSGSRYTGTGDNLGWYFDALSFSDVATLSAVVTTPLAGTTGSFTPPAGTYLMSVAPVISGRDFPAAYQTLTVSAAPLPSFATWAAGLESANSLAAGTISSPDGDPDHDGRSNLIEYAFGTSPVIGNDPAPRMPTAQGSATHFVLQYQRDTSLSDLTFDAQAGAGLENWKTPGAPGAPVGFADVLISTNGTIETREARIPKSSGGTWFMRIRISRP